MKLSWNSAPEGGGGRPFLNRQFIPSFSIKLKSENTKENSKIIPGYYRGLGSYSPIPFRVFGPGRHLDRHDKVDRQSRRKRVRTNSRKCRGNSKISRAWFNTTVQIRFFLRCPTSVRALGSLCEVVVTTSKSGSDRSMMSKYCVTREKPR